MVGSSMAIREECSCQSGFFYGCRTCFRYPNSTTSSNTNGFSFLNGFMSLQSSCNSSSCEGSSNSGSSSSDQETDGSWVDCTLSLGRPGTTTTTTRMSGGEGRYCYWDVVKGSSIGSTAVKAGQDHGVLGFNGGVGQRSTSTSAITNGSSGAGRAAGGFISKVVNSGRGVESSSLLSRRCANCDTTSTPLWRNGPRGPKSLCNACGIRYKKEERRATAMELQQDHHHHQIINTTTTHQYPINMNNNNQNWRYGSSQFQATPTMPGISSEFRLLSDTDQSEPATGPCLSWCLNISTTAHDRATSLRSMT